MGASRPLRTRASAGAGVRGRSVGAVSDSARSAAALELLDCIAEPAPPATFDRSHLVAVGAATVLVLGMVSAAPLVAVDAAVRDAIATMSWGHRATVDIRWFASFAPWYGAVLVALGVLVARRRGATAAEIGHLGVGLALGLVLAHGIKAACWRARPVFPVGGMQLDSFPSGHTASLAFCVAAALHLCALRSRGDDRWWYATAVVGGILTAGVAFARVYLQRHWATDVTASLLMAVVYWGSASTVRVPRVWLGLTLLLGLLALAGVHTVLPSPPSTTAWRAKAHPARRADASGPDVRRALRASSASRP